MSVARRMGDPALQVLERSFGDEQLMRIQDIVRIQIVGVAELEVIEISQRLNDRGSRVLQHNDRSSRDLEGLRQAGKWFGLRGLGRELVKHDKLLIPQFSFETFQESLPANRLRQTVGE